LKKVVTGLGLALSTSSPLSSIIARPDVSYFLTDDDVVEIPDADVAAAELVASAVVAHVPVAPVGHCDGVGRGRDSLLLDVGCKSCPALPSAALPRLPTCC
jgi:hypothetical protein